MLLHKALDRLKKLEYGENVELLTAVIDDAVAQTGEDADMAKTVENGLLGILQADKSTHNAKDYACRKLKVVATSHSIKKLTEMLHDEKLSHMARYVLQAMPGAEAGKALLEALPKLGGDLKAGVIGSLGVRQEEGAVASLAALLSDGDATISTAAASALGAIRSKDAAKALSAAKPNALAVPVAIDSSLACAESLLAAGNKLEALKIYRQLAKGDPPRHVKLAAKKGMLACAAG